jgi:hypothetical protein
MAGFENLTIMIESPELRELGCTDLDWLCAYVQASFPCKGCGSSCKAYSSASGFLCDGSGLSGYSNDAHCEWIIAPAGGGYVTITVTELDTQYHIEQATGS